MSAITPFLWFDGKAEEAARFYVSVFPRSKILALDCIGDGGPDGKTRMASVTFRLGDRTFMALDGGPQFEFTPAVSFFVNCKDQKEVDRFWEALSKGGKKGQCGWLQDRYGVSWQIVPEALGEVLGGADPEGAARAMQAMLKMRKLDVGKLRRAYAGR